MKPYRPHLSHGDDHFFLPCLLQAGPLSPVRLCNPWKMLHFDCCGGFCQCPAPTVWALPFPRPDRLPAAPVWIALPGSYSPSLGEATLAVGTAGWAPQGLSTPSPITDEICFRSRSSLTPWYGTSKGELHLLFWSPQRIPLLVSAVATSYMMPPAFVIFLASQPSPSLPK